MWFPISNIPHNRQTNVTPFNYLCKNKPKHVVLSDEFHSKTKHNHGVLQMVIKSLWHACILPNNDFHLVDRPGDSCFDSSHYGCTENVF